MMTEKEYYNAVYGVFGPKDETLPFGKYISQKAYENDTPLMDVVKEKSQAKINVALTTPCGETYRVLLQQKLPGGGAVSSYPIRGNLKECEEYIREFSLGPMYYAAFAVDQRDNSVEYWILENGQSWHDAVRGDGASYRPADKTFEYQRDGESRKDFEKRIGYMAKAMNF